jgi:ribose transport system substrate-binding protein
MTSSRPLALVGAAAAAALALSACTSAVEAGPEPGATAETLGRVATEAQAVVDSVTRPVPAFLPPGPELGDLSGLAGGTVYYIPATFQVPMFLNIGNALTEALAHLDITVQTCDGKANPADIASCLGQALDADADAVIAGSIPDELAAVAFEEVRSAGIPLLYMQVAPEGPGAPDKVAYLTPDYIAMQSWNASWVVADSNGEADVLVVKVTDTPATILWIEQGALATYESACPECTTTVVETNTGQLDKLPSLVSSALVKNPDIGYVHVAFDVAVQPVIQGIQSSGRTDDLKVVSQDGVLPVMQSLAGEQFVASEVGFNQEALAWYGADQVLRMMSGQPSVQHQQFPYRRLFTRDAAAELDISADGEASGEWFGSTDYKEGFLALWGAS